MATGDPDALPTYRERDLSVRGTRIRVRSAGSGPPLLYLHGAGDSGTWRPVLSELGTDRTVIRPDHPGFNDSDDFPDVDSVHDLAFFYLDLLDELGVDRAAVVGSSLGGWLAADLATIEPARVDRLVLVGAAGLRAEVDTPDMFTCSPAELAELTWATPQARADAVAQASALEEDPAAFERYLRNRMTTAHLGWNPYLHDPKLPGRLHRIRCPVLIVWGEADRLLPPAYADRWREELPHADLAVIPDAGHLPHVEQPDAFLKAVRDVLSRDVAAERGNA